MSLLLLLFCLFINIQAQTSDSFEPLIETTDNVANVYWSSDSKSLVFSTQPIIGDTKEQWYSTDFKSDGASPSLQKITSDQALVALFGETSMIDTEGLRNLKRGTDGNGAESLIIPSPNNLYYVYVGEMQEMRYEGQTPFYAYPLILVDVLRNQSLVVPELPIFDLDDSNIFYHINWSQDSTAFTVSTRSDFAAENLYYVSAYSPELSSVTVERVRSVSVEDQIVGVEPEFSSLSVDGKQVLLRVIVYTSEDIESNLLLWNVENPNMNQILIDEAFSGASFSADGKSIIFIGHAGLQKINLMTKEVALLDASIHSKWAYRAWFSPDRRWMAFAALGDSAPAAQLYVIPVPDGSEP